MTEFEVEAGFPIQQAAEGSGDVVASRLPDGPIAVTMQAGACDGLSAAYQALGSWLAEEGVKAASAPWEAYVTDPNEQPDPAN